MTRSPRPGGDKGAADHAPPGLFLSGRFETGRDLLRRSDELDSQALTAGLDADGNAPHIEGQNQRTDFMGASAQQTNLGAQQLTAPVDDAFEQLDPHA